jgi:uncharacterized protein (TIGR02391 family)
MPGRPPCPRSHPRAQLPIRNITRRRAPHPERRQPTRPAPALVVHQPGGGTTPPTVDVAQMHPAVWGQTARLWRDGHYRQAVSAAADAVVQLAKSRTGRNDIPDTSQWQQAFSKDDPQPGKPRLRWPGHQTDQTVKSMNEGLRNFAPGAQMTIRNPATHGPGEITQQEAVERLSVLSLLARWVDQCDLIEAPDPPSGTP